MKLDLTISNALKLFNSNKLEDGKSVLESILHNNPDNIQAHQLLVKYALTCKNYKLAEQHLLELLKHQPTNGNFIDLFVDLYSIQKKWKDISLFYLNLIKITPSNAVNQFNCAFYLKRVGDFMGAISHYNMAMELGISQDYEVSLNIAAIYSEHLAQPDKSIAILLEAIKKHPKQDSLLYNLANIYEQIGNKEKALSFFQLAFHQNTANYDALARQADIYKVKNNKDALITSMKAVYHDIKISPADKINLCYSLGKAHDDCKEYSSAFEYYQQANTLDKKTLPTYNRKANEEYIDNIINIFSKSWFQKFQSSNVNLFNNPPIFICGMFRSGSTLCEQILSGHSKISIGGEQEFFHRTTINSYPNYPNGVIDSLSENKNKLLSSYKKEVEKQQKKGTQLTDKRPDNFLYLGIIKALMPNAKIIWTKRMMLDNCLSIFFLRLGSSMSYATEIDNIIHFYRQQERLMEHWKSVFGSSIYEFDYDELVSSPEQNIKKLLSFCDLEWERTCVDFHKVKNQVKTASVWQVRTPLYKGSSGRWRNYQDFLILKDKNGE